MVRALCAAGADKEAVDLKGDTSHAVAVSQRHAEVARALRQGQGQAEEEVEAAAEEAAPGPASAAVAGGRRSSGGSKRAAGEASNKQRRGSGVSDVAAAAAAVCAERKRGGSSGGQSVTGGQTGAEQGLVVSAPEGDGADEAEAPPSAKKQRRLEQAATGSDPAAACQARSLSAAVGAGSGLLGPVATLDAHLVMPGGMFI